MSPLIRRLVWLWAVGGLAASLTSLYVHNQLLANPNYRSFCDVTAMVSCTDAYLSRYGTFAGVPVALFGVIFFAGVLVLCGIAAALPSVLGDSSASYIFVVSTVGLAVILYLGYAAFFILKAVCILCLTTYAAVIALFILSGIATSIPMFKLPHRLPTDLRGLAARPFALVVIVLFLVVSASAVAFFPKNGVAAPADSEQGTPAVTDSQLEAWWLSFPRISVPVSAEGAVVVIVKFTDYQCPACGQTFVGYGPVIAKYQKLYPGKVKFISKDYPLQPDCNNNVQRPLHVAACDAAVAVRLARQQGRADALEGYLYTHQPFLTPASVREYAQTIGGVRDFDGQYQNALQGVKADAALGRLLGLRVTPTFFINGVRAEGGAITPEQLDFAIRYELKKAGAGK